MKSFDRIYQKSDLLQQLSDLHIPRDRGVMVHSSLRLIGHVEGGAQTILDTLIEYFTADGGMLCIPPIHGRIWKMRRSLWI